MDEKLVIEGYVANGAWLPAQQSKFGVKHGRIDTTFFGNCRPTELYEPVKATLIIELPVSPELKATWSKPARYL